MRAHLCFLRSFIVIWTAGLAAIVWAVFDAKNSLTLINPHPDILQRACSASLVFLLGVLRILPLIVFGHAGSVQEPVIATLAQGFGFQGSHKPWPPIWMRDPHHSPQFLSLPLAKSAKFPGAHASGDLCDLWSWPIPISGAHPDRTS